MAQTIERFNSFSYSVNEGLLQTTIHDIAFDKNNFCWLSFPNGIQKFDGNNFTNVSVQPGLPDDKFATFFRCSNGDLLISHSEGISKYVTAGNRFVQIYTLSGPKIPVQFIGEDENIIYFYTQSGTIAGMDCVTYKIVKEVKTSFYDQTFSSDFRPKLSSNIINHKVAILVKSTLFLWDLQKEKLVSRSAPIPDISQYFLRLKTESEVLYFTYKINNAILLYDFKSSASSSIVIKGKDDKEISRFIIHPWQNGLLLAITSKLYKVDPVTLELKAEMVNFQNQSIASTSGIASLLEDNFGNLFIRTVTGGIKKIAGNNYPIKYYGTDKMENNFIISILPDKKANRIIAGTYGNGLLIFDTLQRLVKHIKMLPGQNEPFSSNAILKNSKGDYLLFNTGEQYVWVLKNDLSTAHSIPITSSLPKSRSGIDFFGNFLFRNGEKAVVQSQGMLFTTNLTNNKVKEHEVTTSYSMGAMLYNDIIITHANDELILLDTATYKEIKKIPFKNTGYVRCFVKDTDNNIYIGSNNGIYKIDIAGKILLHLKKENGLPDDCIYAMVFDKEGFLWCSTNKGIFKLNKDNSILQLNKKDGLQENEFNTNVVAKTEDGEIFFGGVNGVSSFYPSSISNFKENMNLLVTRIKINNEEIFRDSAVWNINKIDLSHNQNSLSFDFIAMANSNPSQYIYQYKMDGIDKQWIQNTGLQTVRYFLQPGKYVFKIYASRFFNKDAKPMKEIRIIIHPPFWKTWWFFTGISILLLSLMGFFINQYTRKKYKKKLLELEGEHKIQLERERISRDLHDNIGAYANAVLYNTELLEKEQQTLLRNELMKDLKFASKDIITSLRETIWALKKDNYTAHDCLIRIRNFVQPFSRYYPHIHFKIEGEASSEIYLHYTKALNVVRIVQEAVTNAIKHSGAANITIISTQHENKWKLQVNDDGTGIVKDSMRGVDEGNGLENMKRRAAEASIGFTILSEMKSGTSINIVV